MSELSPETEMWRHFQYSNLVRRWTIKRIGVRLLTVVAILLTAELSCRIFLEGNHRLWVSNDELGRMYQPNLDVTHHDRESDNYIRIQTNSLGFREKEFGRREDRSIRRIAIFGDSYTAGQGVNADENLCKQLERLLNSETARTLDSTGDAPESLRRSGRTTRWEVVNLGIPGTCTGGQMRKYERLRETIDADIVIVNFTGTDVIQALPNASDSNVLVYRSGADGQPEALPCKQASFLNRWSYAYRWQKVRSNAILEKLRTSSETKTKPESLFRTYCCSIPEPAATTSAYGLVSDILQRFRTLCEEDGAALVLASIPASVQVYEAQQRGSAEDSPNREIDIDLVDQRLRGICDHQRLPFFALAKRFRERSPSSDGLDDSEQLYFGGNGHLSAAGHRAVAEELFRSLKMQGLVRAVSD